MGTELTQTQVDSYREDGFVVVEGFLTADELAQWRTAVDEAVAQRGRQRVPGRSSGDSVDDYYDQVFIQRVNLWQGHDGIKSLILDPRIGQMCCELEGIDGVRVWHDQALIKEPWANPTSWHLDNPYWSFYSRHSISIWIALDDATPHNGCLYFLPGTHRQARYDNVNIGQNLRALFDVYPAWADLEPVAAPMKAGSCSFHNGLTAHAAGANMTPRHRRAMTCAFMPVGSTFNGEQNILTDEQMVQLTAGQVLDDDKQNPVIYSH